MAITLSDFDNIWASSSPLTPYSFTDANYKEGWNFIGATPPSRQMWDFLQKNNDEKQQYIVQNFLPLSGGTMTGPITLANGKGILRSYSNGTYLYGDDQTSSSQIALYTIADGSGFRIRASDGINNKDIIGKSDGTLTWNGKEVERVNASGTNYIRYVSGLQICFASVAGSNAGTSATFPVAFSANPIITVSSVNSNATAWVTDLSTTGFSAHTSSGAWLWYIAIGKY